MSPPESVRNGSSIYSMSKYASKKSVTKDVVDFDDDEDDDNDASDGPFLPKRAFEQRVFCISLQSLKQPSFLSLSKHFFYYSNEDGSSG